MHGRGWAFLFLIAGAYYFLSGVAILFFPRYEWNLDNWWRPLVLGAIFLLVSVLLFIRRRNELEAHEQWLSDYAAWQQELSELAQIAHEREMERLEKQLEIERAELAKIKAQSSVEFGKK